VKVHIKRSHCYQAWVFIFGVLPATFWFLLGSFISLGAFNNITNYWLWFVFYLASLMGTLGFWIELLLKNKSVKSRLFVQLMMVVGVVVALIIYYSEPRFFKSVVLLVFSPIVTGVYVFWVNWQRLRLRTNGV